jgi:hypothetical protein
MIMMIKHAEQGNSKKIKFFQGRNTKAETNGMQILWKNYYLY